MNRNTIIGIVVLIVLLIVIAWYAGWYGGGAPMETEAPPATTEQPAQSESGSTGN